VLRKVKIQEGSLLRTALLVLLSSLPVPPVSTLVIETAGTYLQEPLGNYLWVIST
jgi:hypothetical protein